MNEAPRDESLGSVLVALAANTAIARLYLTPVEPPGIRGPAPNGPASGE